VPLGQLLRHWLALLGSADESVGHGDWRVSMSATRTPPSLFGSEQKSCAGGVVDQSPQVPQAPRSCRYSVVRVVTVRLMGAAKAVDARSTGVRLELAVSAVDGRSTGVRFESPGAATNARG